MDAILFISGGSEFIHLAIQQTFIVYPPFADSVLVPIKDPGKKINSLFRNTFLQRSSRK